MSPRPTTFVAVDLAAIEHNASQIIARLDQKSRLCAVVKANAYGHGMVPVAQACVQAGAPWLACSTVEEGVQLREAGIPTPVLVFMPPAADEAAAIVAHDLTATVTCTAQIMELNREGEQQGKVGQAHIHEDLGLGRLGSEEGILAIIDAAEPWPHVEVSGVYSHFGPPGSGVNLDAVEWLREGASLKLYASVLFDSIKQVTDRRLMFHCAASALFLEKRESHFDMVRIGTLLYGQYPDHIPAADRDLDLRNTFELRSTIVSVHELEKGAKVGYGGEFTCSRRTRVATVPVGFAHGLTMVPESVAGRWRFCAKGLLRARGSRRGKLDLLPAATVCDRPAPIIGRVSMDQCCLDVTSIPEAVRGTQVVLPARRVTTNPQIPRIYESSESE